MTQDPIVLPDPPEATGPLTPDDLAYMREVQAEHRPVAATLVRRTETPDGMGGVTTSPGASQPVAIRVTQPDEVPQPLAERYDVGVVTITLDLVVVTSGDKLEVSPTEVYEVVSDGAMSAWTTAQQVMAVRTTWPAGGA